VDMLIEARPYFLFYRTVNTVKHIIALMYKYGFVNGVIVTRKKIVIFKRVYAAFPFEQQTEKTYYKESGGKKEIQQLVYNGEVLICFSTTERQGDGKL